MSYGELDRLTSSIYAYLTDIGIGREDFVMIDLPRGINVAVAAIGVWRAGAAYVIVDEGTPDSIKDYMYQDCGCRLLIDQETYAQMIDTPGKMGTQKQICMTWHMSYTPRALQGILKAWFMNTVL